MYQFILEKYRGKSSRYSCPLCNAPHEFTRYIDKNGNYLTETVGKCNRESKCGYHYKPKDFFRDNPEFHNLTKSSQNEVFDFRKAKTPSVNYCKIAANFQSEGKYSELNNLPSQNYSKIAINFLPDDLVFDSCRNHKQNTFVQFLLNLFPDDKDLVDEAVKKYLIGTFEGKTVFWQIDRRGRIRTGKLMLYNNQTGKRIAETFTNPKGEKVEVKVNWLHNRLKKQGKLNADFTLKQCYFGEHLLPENTGKDIAIVESEKTAVIASICIPELIWLATGGKQNLKVEDLQCFGDRQIILFPDADGFAKWNEIARIGRTRGLDVNVSTLIEDFATAEQKHEGVDLADFLIREQQEINSYNLYADRYNSVVDKILSDKILIGEFETILDEQKAILIIDGGIDESEAESEITKRENIHRLALSLV